jgi:Polyketide cyclase / dehydrase and lipid transport
VSVDVLTDVEIARPVSEVAAYAADPSNATAWYRNIEAVTWRSEPPVRVGSRVAFRARFLGRTLEYTYEVVAFEPLERLVMRTSDGPFPMQTTYAWASVHGGTRMSLRNTGEAGRYLRLAGPALEAAMRRANRGDLARLKRLLETRG